MADQRTTWDMTFGWIKPGPADRSTSELYNMSPDGLDWSIYTMPLSRKMANTETFDVEGFKAERDSILRAIPLFLEYHDLDFFLVGGGLIGCAMGRDWNIEIRDRAREAANGTYVTTAMLAITDSLDFLGAKRVAVGTPFKQSKYQQIVDFLVPQGYEITAINGFDHTSSSRALRAVGWDMPYEQGKRAFEAAPGAQAIYLPSPSWRASLAIERLEQECGVPVLTMFNTMLWAGLQATNYKGPVPSAAGTLVQKVAVG